MAYAQGERSNDWEQVSVDKNKSTEVEDSAIVDAGSRIEPPEQLDTSENGAEGSAQDKFDEVEQSICEGDLTPVVAIPSMPARCMANIFGVGNVLSGKYYVSNVSCTFNKSGISQTIRVRKAEFGGEMRKTDDSRDGRPSPLIR